MPEIDHHPEHEPRYSCSACSDTGIDNDSREYCECSLGKARCNNDKFSEMLRGSTFTDAMWVINQATVKAERATAAAENAVLLHKLNFAQTKLAELEREVAELRAAAIPAGYALVPVEPTKELLYIIAHDDYPADLNAGKAAQWRLGHTIIPPRVEYEIAYGQYQRLLAAAMSPQDQKEGV